MGATASRQRDGLRAVVGAELAEDGGDVLLDAAHQRSPSSLGHSRSIVRVNEFQPAPMPFWQIDRLQAEDSANLVRKRYAIGGEVPLPPAKMRDPLRLQQPGFTFA